MGIGKYEFKVVGESLESRPFTGSHLPDALAVNLAFDMGYRGKIGEAIVDNEVSLPSHATADESRGNTVEILDLVSEPMAGSLVSRPVLPEGLQIHVAQIVFDRNWILFHDVGNTGLGVGGLRELEPGTVYVVSECYNVDTFPVLRHSVILAVQDLVQRRIAHILESVDNHIKGPSFVMNRETLDVLTEDDLWSVEIADSDNIEEQGSAGHALIVVFKSLLPAGDREGLTRKSSKAYVKVWDILLVNLGDVAVDLGGGVEVGLVGLLGILVPFAGEDRLDFVAEGFVESHADSAYPREEVYGLVFGRHLSLTTFSILSAQPERSFWISFPQNLRTIQPCSSSSWFTSKSLCMFLSIFGIQNSL